MSTPEDDTLAPELYVPTRTLSLGGAGEYGWLGTDGDLVFLSS